MQKNKIIAKISLKLTALSEKKIYLFLTTVTEVYIPTPFWKFTAAKILKINNCLLNVAYRERNWVDDNNVFNYFFINVFSMCDWLHAPFCLWCVPEKFPDLYRDAFHLLIDVDIFRTVKFDCIFIIRKKKKKKLLEKFWFFINFANRINDSKNFPWTPKVYIFSHCKRNMKFEKT